MIWEIEDSRTVIEGLDEHGRADPGYAAALGLKPAPLGRRALASLIEFAMYAFLQLPYWIVAVPTLLKVATGAIAPAGLLSHPNFVWMVVATSLSAVLTIAFVIVQLALHARKGVTLGKSFVGIRSINVKTLAKPGFGKAVLRALVLYLGFLVPVVGPVLLFVSVFFDSEKRGRGWLDKVGATWFVDVKHGLDPYHEKRMRIARKTVRAEPEAAQSSLPSLATPSDRAAQGYRPGARLSSGVVGVARPQQLGQPQVGLTGRAAAEPLPEHTAPGMPMGGARLGGYRPGDLSGVGRPTQGQAEPQGTSAAPAARAPSAPDLGRAPSASSPAPSHAHPIAGIVDSVPGRDRASQRPEQPALPQDSAPSRPQETSSPIADETVIEPDFDTVAEPIDDSTVRRVEIAQDDDLDVTRARPSARAVVATLAFDNGDRFAITGAALVGRNPSATEGEVVEHLLPVADDTRSISKTHLLITAVPLAAVDRASTNGSSVLRAGVEHALEPGAAFPLELGDVIRFGDRSVTIEPGTPGAAG